MGRDVLRAEWTKLRTAPGTPWLLLGIVTLTVALSAAASATATCPAGGCAVDTARTSLTGVYLGQALAAILGVSVIGGEYGTRMIGVTLAALPRRSAVLAAKASVLTALALAASTVAVAGSLLAGRLLLPGNGFDTAHGYPPLSLADAAVRRAAVGTALYLTCIALLSLGVATAVRDSTSAIGIVLGLLYVVPIVVQVIHDQHWQHRLERIAPMSAGLSVQATRGLHDLPISPWHGLGVVALWAAGALLVGATVLRARDA